MELKTLIIAAGIVGGTATAAFAQAGWEGLATPGTPSYGFGCYGCSPGAGQGPAGGGLYDYASVPYLYNYAAPVAYISDPFHTGSDYLWFRSIGPERGNSAASQR